MSQREVVLDPTCQSDIQFSRLLCRHIGSPCTWGQGCSADKLDHLVLGVMSAMTGSVLIVSVLGSAGPIFGAPLVWGSTCLGLHLFPLEILSQQSSDAAKNNIFTVPYKKRCRSLAYSYVKLTRVILQQMPSFGKVAQFNNSPTPGFQL